MSEEFALVLRHDTRSVPPAIEKLLAAAAGDRLLPRRIERRRANAKVVDVPAKSYPAGYFVRAPVDSDGTSAHFDEKTFSPDKLIAAVSGCGDLALYRKAFPHCLFGMMLLSHGTRGQSALADFTQNVRRGFLSKCCAFAAHCKFIGLVPNISWSFDPATRDRKSGQSKPWFHVHLNSQPSDTFEAIAARRRRLEEYGDIIDRRLVFDEASIIAGMMLRDYLEAFELVRAGRLSGPLECDGNPGIAIVFPGGFDALMLESTDAVLGAVHQAFVCAARWLAQVAGSLSPWRRPRIDGLLGDKDFANCSWLAQETVEVSRHYVSRLHDFNVQCLMEFAVANPRHRITQFLFPLAGPNYFVTISENDDGDLLCAIRSQLFSGIGAAGLGYLSGTIVRYTQCRIPYSAIELTTKENFERSVGRALS